MRDLFLLGLGAGFYAVIQRIVFVVSFLRYWRES